MVDKPTTYTDGYWNNYVTCDILVLTLVITHIHMAKRQTGLSASKMPKGPHKTKKRLAAKKTMLAAKKKKRA